MLLRNIAKSLSEIAFAALLMPQWLRRRLIFQICQYHYEELNITVPLGHNTHCPVVRNDHWYSFCEVFVEHQYARVFEITGLPQRWLDLGCHAGYFSLFIAWLYAQQRKSKNFRALLIDADPDSSFAIERLKHANGLSDQIVFRQGVISEGDGSKPFIIQGSMSSSKKDLSVGGGREIQAKIIAQDEIARQLPPPYDLVKVDIEGSEYEFLRCYRNVIEQAQFIVLEWHSWHTGGGSMEQLVAVMKEYGFGELKEILAPQTVHVGHRQGVCGTLLFIASAKQHNIH